MKSVKLLSLVTLVAGSVSLAACTVYESSPPPNVVMVNPQHAKVIPANNTTPTTRQAAIDNAKTRIQARQQNLKPPPEPDTSGDDSASTNTNNGTSAHPIINALKSSATS